MEQTVSERERERERGREGEKGVVYLLLSYNFDNFESNRVYEQKHVQCLAATLTMLTERTLKRKIK